MKPHLARIVQRCQDSPEYELFKYIAIAFRTLGPAHTKSQCRKCIVDAVKTVAANLNNRPATCKNYYIHPAIIDAYENGILLEEVNRPALVGTRSSRYGLSSIEKAVLRILDRQATSTAASQQSAKQ